VVIPIKTIVVIGAGGMGAAHASKFYDLGERVYSLRKTEVEMFAGKVVELGKEYGIPTPVNQTLYRII
jgi:ketopantoate reductase